MLQARERDKTDGRETAEQDEHELHAAGPPLFHHDGHGQDQAEHGQNGREAFAKHEGDQSQRHEIEAGEGIAG